MSERESLLVPEPTMVEAEVLEALAQEPLSHVNPRFGAIFSEALSQTRRLFQLIEGAVFLLAGQRYPGHGDGSGEHGGTGRARAGRTAKPKLNTQRVAAGPWFAPVPG